MNKKSMIIFSVIFLMIIVGSICYSLFSRSRANISGREQIVSREQKEDNKKNEILFTASKNKEVVLPTATIKMKQLYKKCGHVTFEEFPVPEDIVNMAEDEVKKYYFGWNLDEFSERNISLSKENNGLCDEHYVVRDEEGLITIFRKDEKENEILVYSTEVNTKYLPGDDRKRLENGISIVGKDNLATLLEDYE